ncbi:hypothetical protein DERP_001130 [Dermatophagoides pteronyssinus]|uniref:Uncharacterized protein n=1 Tax=Dermatophagoides pteronyssinus TaxID=6956 RepID=A0ABQ8JDM6_DERPT|nr:hypothetical protein DERP_001130 [Dermatophagoides pteronyssinus]
MFLKIQFQNELINSFLEFDSIRKDEQIIQSINDGRMTLHSFLLLSPHIQGRIRREWLKRNKNNETENNDGDERISSLSNILNITTKRSALSQSKKSLEKIINPKQETNIQKKEKHSKMNIGKKNLTIKKKIKTRIPIAKSRFSMAFDESLFDQIQNEIINDDDDKMNLTSIITSKSNVHHHSYNLRRNTGKQNNNNDPKLQPSSKIDFRLPMTKMTTKTKYRQLRMTKTKLNILNDNNHSLITTTSKQTTTTKPIITRVKTSQTFCMLLD